MLIFCAKLSDRFRILLFMICSLLLKSVTKKLVEKTRKMMTTTTKNGKGTTCVWCVETAESSCCVTNAMLVITWAVFIL